MASKKKLLQAAAGSAGGATLDVDEVFSTYLYDGTSSAQNINNGINLGDNIAGSVDFDGAGDSLESSSHSFAYGTGDFTVEFWMYPDSVSGTINIFDNRSGGSTGFLIGINNDTKIRFYWDSADRIVDSATVSTGQWYHIAVARSSGTTKMFKNGTQIGSDYSDSNNYTSSVLEIGQRSISDGLEFDGKLSNVRVVLGTALYTANFTTPTEPLTAISGTELLICTANNLEDEGPNNISFTVKGDPQVLSSSPFTGNTGEGGLVWHKSRTSTQTHFISDTERGATKLLSPNNTDAEETQQGLTSFNSNGFTVNNLFANASGEDYVSWTFRKAPKFFDVVTYSGNGSSQTISHNLGTTVGWLLIKRTDTTGSWFNYHHGFSKSGNPQGAILNETGAAFTANASLWNLTYPTNTHFTVGDNNSVNASGGTYVAYLFAHNNNDGGFGPDSDQDIIKCGSYTGNGSASGPTVNLGFEPQWVLIKLASGSGENWILMDNMRGLPVGGNDTQFEINENSAETSTSETLNLTATGFDIKSTSNGINTNNQTYIYMAIRRGPLAEPESATDVFSIDTLGTSAPYFDSNHIVDMGLVKQTGAASSWFVYTRLAGEKNFYTDFTAAENNASEAGFDFMNGHIDSNWGGTNSYSWMWKRAPSYFDVVCYTGNLLQHNENHNLGVVPEMIWTKSRNNSYRWGVYHKDIGVGAASGSNGTGLRLDTSDGLNAGGDSPLYQHPTATQFQPRGTQNQNHTYIAYLFATVAGVSKVGSYTGNGSSQTIDCGFSSGARFVIIKRASAAEDWLVHDSVRGIVSGSGDPYLALNSSDQQFTSQNYVDPHSSGFIVPTGDTQTNNNGDTYIFYAIA